VIGALSITPSYMRNKHSESGQVIDYRDWQIPLGRRFRALKVWFVMRTYGLQGLKDYIRKHIGLGELFHSLVVSRPDLFEVLTGPAFALTVFRAKPPAQLQSTSSAASTGNTAGSVASGEGNVAAALDANALTKAVADAIFGEREIFLTSVDLRGKFAIRVVSANEKADEAHVRKAFDIIVRTTEAILRQHGY
jgi:aromatic-L-amino-acid decarboxylase